MNDSFENSRKHDKGDIYLQAQRNFLNQLAKFPRVETYKSFVEENDRLLSESDDLDAIAAPWWVPLVRRHAAVARKYAKNDTDRNALYGAAAVEFKECIRRFRERWLEDIADAKRRAKRSGEGTKSEAPKRTLVEFFEFIQRTMNTRASYDHRGQDTHGIGGTKYTVNLTRILKEIVVQNRQDEVRHPGSFVSAELTFEEKQQVLGVAIEKAEKETNRSLRSDPDAISRLEERVNQLRNGENKDVKISFSRRLVAKSLNDPTSDEDGNETNVIDVFDPGKRADPGWQGLGGMPDPLAELEGKREVAAMLNAQPNLMALIDDVWSGHQEKSYENDLKEGGDYHYRVFLAAKAYFVNDLLVELDKAEPVPPKALLEKNTLDPTEDLTRVRAVKWYFYRDTRARAKAKDFGLEKPSKIKRRKPKQGEDSAPESRPPSAIALPGS